MKVRASVATLGKKRGSPDAAPFYCRFVTADLCQCCASAATRLAEAAGVADVEVTLEIWPHMIHAWPLWNATLSDGRAALAHAGEFMRRHFVVEER